MATIGPASDDPAVLRGLIDAGMDAARVGLAHGDVSDSIARIRRIRAAAAAANRHIAVLVDLWPSLSLRQYLSPIPPIYGSVSSDMVLAEFPMQDDMITSATATGTTSRDTPHRLIASNRVEGTAVYNREGEKLGRIENFMVDKVSNKGLPAFLCGLSITS